jgi:threonine dehydrogenase-like Zn-dependent dehydrogenase
VAGGGNVEDDALRPEADVELDHLAGGVAEVADGVADAKHGWFECYEIQRKVDKSIPVEAAALLCTWREVYGGFGDFQLKKGDEIIVFGVGPVGLSFVKFGKLLGLKWIGVVDPLEHKRKRALEMGADAVFAPDSEALANLVKERGKPLDAIIDAVGNENIINAGLPLIKMGGSICVYGVLAAEKVQLHKSKGPYNFNLFMHQWPTLFRDREAQATLCKWIRQGKLRPSDSITHEFPVEKINDALAAVKSGNVVKCLLRY